MRAESCGSDVLRGLIKDWGNPFPFLSAAPPSLTLDAFCDRHRPVSRGCAILDAELPEDVLEVLFHGPITQTEDRRDGVIGFALRDPRQDFALAVREAERLERCWMK